MERYRETRLEWRFGLESLHYCTIVGYTLTCLIGREMEREELRRAIRGGIKDRNLKFLFEDRITCCNDNLQYFLQFFSVRSDLWGNTPVISSSPVPK